MHKTRWLTCLLAALSGHISQVWQFTEMHTELRLHMQYSCTGLGQRMRIDSHRHMQVQTMRFELLHRRALLQSAAPVTVVRTEGEFTGALRDGAARIEVRQHLDFTDWVLPQVLHSTAILSVRCSHPAPCLSKKNCSPPKRQPEVSLFCAGKLFISTICEYTTPVFCAREVCDSSELKCCSSYRRTVGERPPLRACGRTTSRGWAHGAV